MKFVKIEMLFLIWAVPLLFLMFFYGMKKRGRILSRFASPKGLKAIVPGGTSHRRWIKAGLILSALLFISLALSGPQYGYRWQEIERKGIDIIIALDCSRSMLATDIKPTRLDRAKREVYDLLTMLKGDRVGLVAFAGTAFLQCPLTLDYSAFNIFLNTLSPGYLPVGGTDITGAVLTSLASFDQKTNSEKAIILITDGENTGEGDPLKTAEEAKEAGVKLFCIGVGSEAGVPVPDKKGGFKKDASGKIILTKLDEDTLKKMAIVTGGIYVRSVAGDMDLDAIYTNEIRGKMEAETLESGRKQIWEDRYQWLLVLAIIALITELFLPSVRKTAAVSGILIFTLLFFPVPCHAGPMQEGLEAYKNGEYDKALKLFIDAQLDNPDDPRILYNIGNAYYKVEDFDSAISNFEEVLKSEDKTLREKALYNLGNANYRKGKYEDAVKNYQEAIKTDPKDVRAKQNLEFVKKVIEQKKEEQKQPQEGDSKEDDSEKKEDSEDQKDGSEKGEDESKEDQSEQKDPGQEDSEKETPEYGDEMDDQEKDSKQAKPSQEENEDEDEEKAGAAKETPSQDEQEGDDKKQAERMLNRLKDQPGKAMIPAYRKRQVEKDW